MKQSEIIELLNVQHSIILSCEAKLASSDYIANKIAEGKATQDDYADQIEERQSWRDEINAAKAEIARLEALEPEDEDEPIEEESE